MPLCVCVCVKFYETWPLFYYMTHVWLTVVCMYRCLSLPQCVWNILAGEKVCLSASMCPCVCVCECERESDLLAASQVFEGQVTGQRSLGSGRRHHHGITVWARLTCRVFDNIRALLFKLCLCPLCHVCFLHVDVVICHRARSTWACAGGRGSHLGSVACVVLLHGVRPLTGQHGRAMRGRLDRKGKSEKGYFWSLLSKYFH